MSEELQQKLRDQLWEVANKLRGNMSASDFMYFTLGTPMTHWWMMKLLLKNCGQWRKTKI